MKKTVLAIAAFAFLVNIAHAQFSGQLSAAPTEPQGTSRLGGYVAVYENAFGVLGQYRYGLGGFTDIGFKFGFVSWENGVHGNGAGVVLSVDPKYQVMEVRIKDPFDLSLGGVAEFMALEHSSLISFGFTGVGSYPFKLSNGNTLSPYGRLIMRIKHMTSDFGASHTEFDMALNMGMTFRFAQTTQALAEIQVDPDNFSFFMGMDFGL